MLLVPRGLDEKVRSDILPPSASVPIMSRVIRGLDLYHIRVLNYICIISTHMLLCNINKHILLCIYYYINIVNHVLQMRKKGPKDQIVICGRVEPGNGSHMIYILSCHVVTSYSWKHTFYLSLNWASLSVYVSVHI